MNMDKDQDRLYRDLAASMTDDERAAAWHAFVRNAGTDGDVQRLRTLLGRSDPAAVIDWLNEEAPFRAKQTARALRLDGPPSPPEPQNALRPPKR